MSNCLPSSRTTVAGSPSPRSKILAIEAFNSGETQIVAVAAATASTTKKRRRANSHSEESSFDDDDDDDVCELDGERAVSFNLPQRH